jgi:UDP-N-acetylglucosamine--N-acetylmuramyl-(pentapeptide) pyrophosphoryl-undecaprenol N-acetylglucosamine transferase
MGSQAVVLLAGGGTGGHVYPGLSVALALRQVWPEIQPLFLVTEREIDRVILAPTGFEFQTQPIVPPHRTIGGLLAFWRSWRETKDLVRRLLRHRPVAAVLGLGGYAAGVAVKLAAERGLPTAILNPDVIPGKANQYLMKRVRLVCCQYEQTRQHVAATFHDRLRFTGCPIRPEMASVPPRELAAGRLGLDPSKMTLVVTGASQGAQTVNEAVLEVAPRLNLQGWQILHLAGRDHAKAVAAGYVQRSVQARVIDFTPAMADVWAVADLAITRSGASTCAEIAVCGIPSILVPYPFHKDMHQRANARVLEAAGAALILNDERHARKNAAKLQPILESLLYDAPRRAALAAAARKLAKPQAAIEVATVLRDLAG